MNKYLYHGSDIPNIKTLRPFKRSTPGAYRGREIPPAIYAADDPAYCLGHSISWGSDEGFKLGYYSNGPCVFEIPIEHKDRIMIPVYLYKVSSDKFKLLSDVEPLGHNYWALEPVEVLDVVEFPNVVEGFKKYNGIIKYI